MNGGISSGDINQIINVIMGLISVPGYFMIFKKCNVAGWKSFIPFYRDYQLGKCAYRENEGQRLLIAAFISEITYNLYNSKFSYLNHSGWLKLLLLVIYIMALISGAIYSLRIYNGLCQVFGRKKRWIWGWLFLKGPTSLIWGASSSFVPLAVVLEDDAPEVFGLEAETIQEGLTVNLKERSVHDFLKKKYLLKDINLNIKPGSMVLLLGGSGAGKSTFINAVTGYEKARAKIFLNGRNVYRDYRDLKYDIGLVPQQDLMRGNDTVISTLSDAATLWLPLSFGKKDRNKRITEVLDFMGLHAVKNSLVSKLSGGQRKRLSIAIEMISDPFLFILDEPDSGLDGVIARELMEKLQEIAHSGHIVIVITHTPDRVRDLFDSTIILAKDSSRTGRLAYYGTIPSAFDFFKRDSMEKILLSINPTDEGGEGRSDEFISSFGNNEVRKEALTNG